MIEYKKTNWQKNTQLSPALFNNIENGIANCVAKLNRIGDWAETETKPKYTAEEVGAMSDRVIELHEMNGSAHSYLFTHHNHSAEAIDGLSEALTKLDEIKSSVSSLKGSITKLTSRVKAIEDTLKENDSI